MNEQGKRLLGEDVEFQFEDPSMKALDLVKTGLEIYLATAG